jgi:hypothetical protein
MQLILLNSFITVSCNMTQQNYHIIPSCQKYVFKFVNIKSVKNIICT